MVARSVDGRRLLVGEAKSTPRPRSAAALRFRPHLPAVPGVAGLEVVPVMFAPRASPALVEKGGVHVVNARMVFSVLR